jgi:hypothetical protein
MSQPNFDQYYRDCLRLAEQASSPEQRVLLLRMAQSWRALAEKADRIRDLFQHVTPKGSA